MVLIFQLIINSLCLILLQYVLDSKCESYKSIESLTELVADKDAISGIREFQHMRMNELEKLQMTIEVFEQEHNKALKDRLDYLSNPINAYKLIKRMVVDWKEIHEFVENGKSIKDFANAWASYIEYVELPSESDLHDAIDGLTSTEMDIDAASRIEMYGSKLTWDECYEIGIRLYDKQEYAGALLWLEQALEYMDYDDAYAAIRVDILEYTAYSQYMLGDVQKATLILEQAMEIPIVNSTVPQSMPYFLLHRNSFVQTI